MEEKRSSDGAIAEVHGKQENKETSGKVESKMFMQFNETSSASKGIKEKRRSKDYINSPRHSKKKEVLKTIQISRGRGIARSIINRTRMGPIIWPCWPRGRWRKEVQGCGCDREL